MVATLDIFKPPSDLNEAALILADHMPQGRSFGKKCTEGSVMNGLVKGIASDFLKVQEQIFELAEQFDINITVDLLADWETSVGIPDECIFQFKTLEERRERIIQRLRKIPIVTISELQNYVNAFFPNDDILLLSGSSASSFEYKLEFGFLGDINSRFVIIAEVKLSSSPSVSEFEFDFEFDFSGGPDTFLLECVLRNVLPANVILIINFRE